MKTKLFYFSATGNSLSVAKSLEIHMDSVELISIPEAMDQINNVDVSKVGFVFPVYAYGLPRIVEEFIKKVNLSKVKYVFAVATCGGTPGNTLVQLRNLLKKSGSDLDAGFAVRQNNYTFLDENVFMKFMISIAGEQPYLFKDRIQEIVRIVNNNEAYKLETSSWLANNIGGLLHKMAVNQFKDAGKDFWANDKCSSCGTCVKICPRKNIKIIDDRPVWEQNCESCFACLQWCPEEAIEYQDVSVGKKRLHHGDISLKEMINH